jgi:hypothetical protein
MDITRKKTHWSFWLVGLFALLWNSMGCFNIFMQLSPDLLAAMPESHRSLAEQRPIWATAAFAASVLGGVIAAVLLLCKNAACIPLFVLSLMGTVVATIHGVAMGGILTLFSPAEIALAVVCPVLLSIFLVWYALYCQKKHWIT